MMTMAAAVTLAAVATGCGGGGSTPARKAAPDRMGTAAPPPAPALKGTRVSFAGMSFVLPTGWKVHSSGDRTWEEYGGTPADPTETEHAYHQMCIGPAGSPPVIDNLCGLTILAGDVPGNEHQRPWDDDGFWPWSGAWDATPCPTGGNAPATENYLQAIGGGTASTRGLEPVGSHTAVYREWKVGCTRSNVTFSPRSWHLPTSKVVFFDTFGESQTTAILATVRFGS